MIAIIAAMTKDKVIGKGGKLPWRIPEEMQHFKRTTIGNTVIMGRVSFESLRVPLVERNNIVLTHKDDSMEGVDVVSDVESALAKAESYGKDIYVTGGSVVYRQFLPLVDKLIISYIKKFYDGDTYFPDFDVNEWEIEKKEEHEEFDVVWYRRK
ncbi:MAG: dihydrofolate reductase [Nanoarchaeota archaeon]|nr:dihydrofolate reductase [Nanoarchaeota archaeon]